MAGGNRGEIDLPTKYQNVGRFISQEETLEILSMGIEAGLVLQPSNSQKRLVIWMCCGCCCLVLKNLNRLDNPAKVAYTDNYVTISRDNCTGCGKCENICQMERGIGRADLEFPELYPPNAPGELKE